MHSFVSVGASRLEILQIHAERVERPWLVFLHEGLGSIAMWRDFPQRLCDALNCRGLVYSRSGYGRSSPLPAPRTADYLHHEAIAVLPALCDQLEIDHPLLFGHSDGASIALIHAATYPERAAGVIALAPHIRVEEITIAGIEAARAAWNSTDLRSKLARYHADPEAVFQDWSGIWLDPAFRNWNIEALLAGIRCPVLAIQGEEDEYGTMLQIDGIAANAHRSVVTLCQLAACGHFPQRDRAQAVIAATTAFVEQLQRNESGIDP